MQQKMKKRGQPRLPRRVWGEVLFAQPQKASQSAGGIGQDCQLVSSDEKNPTAGSMGRCRPRVLAVATTCCCVCVGRGWSPATLNRISNRQPARGTAWSRTARVASPWRPDHPKSDAPTVPAAAAAKAPRDPWEAAAEEEARNSGKGGEKKVMPR